MPKGLGLFHLLHEHVVDCVRLSLCPFVFAGGLTRALQGVKSVIALGRLGALLPAAQRAGVERVVLLSTAGKYPAWEPCFMAC